MTLGRGQEQGFGLATRSPSPPIFHAYGGMKHIAVTFTRMKRWKKMTLYAEDKLTSAHMLSRVSLQIHGL